MQLDRRPYHVVPTDDAREHRLGMDCECRPVVQGETEHQPAIIVHTAWDGRETWEHEEQWRRSGHVGHA